jgi:hypothetical protein
MLEQGTWRDMRIEGMRDGAHDFPCAGDLCNSAQLSLGVTTSSLRWPRVVVARLQCWDGKQNCKHCTQVTRWLLLTTTRRAFLGSTADLETSIYDEHVPCRLSALDGG